MTAQPFSLSEIVGTPIRKKRGKTYAPSRPRTRYEKIQLELLFESVAEFKRPRTRAECVSGPRPCLWVSCKYHLYLDVNPQTGTIKLNFPHLEPDQMTHSCALDIADKGGITLEEVGLVTNLTRERVRQIEMTTLPKLRTVEMSEYREGYQGDF